MSIFEDRERAAERKLEQENEFAFKLVARRNKLLGLWAAGHMGLSGTDAARYAMDLVEAGIAKQDDKALTRKITDDLVTRGFPIVERDVQQQLQVLTARARAELLRGISRHT